MELQTIIFIGSSGSGKGTQAELIRTYVCEHDTEKRPILTLETGKLYRNFITTDSLAAHKAAAIYEEGGLMPEFLTIGLWAHFFIENYKGGQHCILDGTPRMVHEAQVLHSLFPFYGRPKASVVYIRTSKEWSYARLKGRGRVDDNDADINARLGWFEEQVLPTVEWYRAHPEYRFVEVVGEQNIEAVHNDIVSGIFG